MSQTISQSDIRKIVSSLKDASVVEVPQDPTHNGANGFFAQGELDLTMGDGSRATVFYMGSDKFYISRDGLAPDYTFESPPLEVWWDRPMVADFAPKSGDGPKSEGYRTR
jgi:hypothetical protein